ncbi:hypothetical protein GWI33_007415 [Rhynchophorus ferrugineus]|uniref:Amidase domain-containing protein n=1 Tax=Rhynchophorus ferrugineus TaxID=354439 RepID=A0A834IEJ8_RHYFE|nr:hypothetical protein GWI33_007415 [Rhynchophorus ferrugineus]
MLSRNKVYYFSGTDLGGSSRIPSFMCGVFAHKMSCNLIGVKGMTFRDGSETTSMISPGPMTKYATDLEPLLKCLVGVKSKELGLDRKVNVRKLNVYYIIDPNDHYCSPIRKEMTEALMRAVNHFKNICTVPPQELFFEELKYCKQMWNYWMSKEPNKNFLNDINNRAGEVSPVREIIKKITVGSDFTIGSIMNFVNILSSNVNGIWVEEITESLKQKLLAKLDDNSILLYPSAPFTARHHYTTIFHPLNFNFFSIWNVLKFPATQIPMGLGEKNLPLGIQIVAKSNQDKLCIVAAIELERRFGGYVPPF